MSDSSLKAWRACCRFGDIPSKTQAFLCFHRIQAPRIQRELNPFLCCFCSFFQDRLHQSAKETLLLLGVKWVRFKGWRTANQNCRANTQDVRMCWIYILTILVTKRTALRMREASFLQPVRCPATISNCQPNKREFKELNRFLSCLPTCLSA